MITQIRIQLSRAKGWQMPDNTVNVARGPGRTWGNPWKVSEPGCLGRVIIGDKRFTPHYEAPIAVSLTAADAVALYRKMVGGVATISLNDLPLTLNARGVQHAREWLWYRGAEIRRCMPNLRGKNLACWCKPGSPCHADVLLELANEVQA